MGVRQVGLEPTASGLVSGVLSDRARDSAKNRCSASKAEAPSELLTHVHFHAKRLFRLLAGGKKEPHCSDCPKGL